MKFLLSPTTLRIAQALVSLVLITLILLQGKGGGLGTAFGGAASVYRTKRGMEKFVFNLTIICGIIFFVLAILSL